MLGDGDLFDIATWYLFSFWKNIEVTNLVCWIKIEQLTFWFCILDLTYKVGTWTVWFWKFGPMVWTAGPCQMHDSQFPREIGSSVAAAKRLDQDSHGCSWYWYWSKGYLQLKEQNPSLTAWNRDSHLFFVSPYDNEHLANLYNSKLWSRPCFCTYISLNTNVYSIFGLLSSISIEGILRWIESNS